MPQLQTLGVDSCPITDAGLQLLSGLALKHFSANYCFRISAGAKDQFKQAHPNCDAMF
jgi:hypothetical protein